MAQKTGSPFLGKTPNKGTFVMGSSNEKDPIGGSIQKGSDLRSQPSKNGGKMPRSM